MSDFKGWFLPAPGMKIHYTANGDTSACGNVYYADAILHREEPHGDRVCRTCAAHVGKEAGE